MASVLYLGGLGRSGTTLLERTLGELPGVVALGEVVHLWQRDVRDNERCGCGTPFADCDFWARVGAEAFDGWAGVDVARVLRLRAAVERTRHIPALARRRLGARRQADVLAYGAYYASVYRAAAAVTGARVVVDSSKHSALAHCLRWMRPGAIDLRVVHMVRDPRGVAHSWTRRVARPEAAGEEMTRYSPARSALLWSAHNAALGLLARRGVPLTLLRYEDFLADPAAAVGRIADFAGLPLRDGDLDFLEPDAVRVGVGHSAAGNPMRFALGRVALRGDEAWRTALPAGQRRLVTALSAPLLRRYGYPLRPAPVARQARHRADAPPAPRPAGDATGTGRGAAAAVRAGR
ncbi:sulfotransferase family protein [Pilimelia terevasa]|uniref:Sulfotransferase family protein n=1 Tax=Pilimelia terevasa TaxID=53372 RepID=A0A8J3BEU9_9ACTN|nr:sulfotransferase [Pilimelia terevasa]GGK14521.1 sulfotransferase family protein [Pilimelia terevasa]